LQEFSHHCERAPIGFAPKNSFKKVLTLGTKIEYHGERFQKRQRLLPGRVLCPFGSHRKKKTIQTRPGKRKNTSMNSSNQVNKLVSCGRDPARSLPLWRGFLLIPLILVCFAFAPQTRAVVPPPDGGYPSFTTAEGQQALQLLTTGVANSGFGWRALFSAGSANFNTGVGAGALVLTNGAANGAGDSNTAVGAAALLLNGTGAQNTAVGTAALLNNAGDPTNFNGFFNDAVGAFALNANVTGFSNNALGNSALFFNIDGASNTAVGDLALEVNDSTGHGMANNNVAVGASALVNDVDGSENTAVGTGAGPNIANGFNNTYVGNFVGTGVGDESSTIRIGDLSGGDSQECFIGGIFNNLQPVNGTTIVQVTLDLTNDHLGFDFGPNQGGRVPFVPHRGTPQPRSRPQPQHQAMLNDKVEKLQATVAQQQKQIETLTTQLREQAAQIQSVSAQLEMVRPAPRVVENR
jgi:hypothetical protein